MTPTKVKYLDDTGAEFDVEADAIASNMMRANRVIVEPFIAKHFPTKEDSKRGNPHAGTAARAIYLWLADHPVSTQ